MRTRNFLLIFVALIFISGCSFDISKINFPFIGGGTPISGKGQFIGGSSGIKSEIVKPSEGGRVRADSEFNINVKVENQGEGKAEGSTCLIGTGYSGCDCQQFSLEGKKLIDGQKLSGEKETLKYSWGLIYEGLEKQTSYVVTAITRYHYMTYGAIRACINYDLDSDGGCKFDPEENIIKSASSGPIGIVKVTQQIDPESGNDDLLRLTLDITLKHIGDGNLYGLDQSLEECRTPENVKKVVNINLINAPGRVQCDPAEFRPGKKEAKAQCVVNDVRVSGGSFETEITIELEYAYETIDSNKFEVIR